MVDWQSENKCSVHRTGPYTNLRSGDPSSSVGAVPASSLVSTILCPGKPKTHLALSTVSLDF